MTGPYTGGAEIDGGEQPGILYPFSDPVAQAGRSGVAGLQFIECAANVFIQAVDVDLVMGRDLVQVGIVMLEDLGKNVLDLDIVVRTGKAKASGAFKSTSRNVVQSPDKGLQVHVHGCSPLNSLHAKGVSAEPNAMPHTEMSVFKLYPGKPGAIPQAAGPAARHLLRKAATLGTMSIRATDAAWPSL